MRPSPPYMRRHVTRRTLAVGLVAALAVAGAACSDDGDGDSTPTTTSPATTEAATTTTEAGGSATTEDGATTTTESDGSTTVPGDDADVLTAEEATAQLQSLLNNYRSALVAIQASGEIDEASMRVLVDAFTTDAARGEINGLRQVGGTSVLNPAVPALTASNVVLDEGTATCTSGTVEVGGLNQVTTTPVDVRSPHYFRIVRAPDGANAPGWRIDFLRFSVDGSALQEAGCP